MKGDKQKELVKKINENGGKITTAEANELLKHYYYCNHEHYVSEILSRMVKGGYLIRVKKGHYEVNNGYRPAKFGGFVSDHPKLFN